MARGCGRSGSFGGGIGVQMKYYNENCRVYFWNQWGSENGLHLTAKLRPLKQKGRTSWNDCVCTFPISIYYYAGQGDKPIQFINLFRKGGM